MRENTEWKITAGNPSRLGAFPENGGYNFAAVFPEGAEASLVLYRAGEQKSALKVPLPEAERTGRVGAVHVSPLEPGEWEYRYQIDGRRMVDPRALEITGRTHFGRRGGEQVRGRLIRKPELKTHPLGIPYEDCVIYKVHVRGFTEQSASKVKKRGTFRGIEEKIPYLKELGITTLLLMPVCEFDELPAPREKRIASAGESTEKQPERINYWGYEKALYLAPKAAYSAEGKPAEEFAHLVDALHEAGLECMLEFYFDASAGARDVIDILSYWLITYHVDGFHLLGDGAWAEAVAREPLFGKTKILYLGFSEDACVSGSGSRRVLGEYNLAYEETMRQFLKGDGGCLAQAAWMLRRNSDTHAYINYFADHDGFTMADMVSYEQKHNEENGEDNRDGCNTNYTWNCGTEGPSRKYSVRKLRLRLLRNAFLILLTSQGTPMIYGGDEFLNSQGGNNNAWCQDNEVGWVSWKRQAAGEQMTAFVKQALAFRKEHPVLHRVGALKETDHKNVGLPELSYHSQRAWVADLENGSRRLGIMYCGAYASRRDGNPDDTVYMIYNMHWEPHAFALPDLPEGMRWYLKADTASEEGFWETGKEKAVCPDEEKKIMAEGRSVMILIGKQE
ncbi:MAG TPA: Type II secretory pathway, pullulanase PulA and related glycosidase [Candidatus Scatomonas pullistercoris]|uniref:Type II secretory pathway, pullulanase PulA and related glycosidase n=1 Tax=Candidatus Scatomonas pullistercoris TaxID=2840920 RepID=A0A9D1P2F2_9FIRM|nr:Type II secretory pathway, pullulanase PulA and related glycosidase [Candidatus Scatomonas pullistercoris]